jgi:hypothetical protein
MRDICATRGAQGDSRSGCHAIMSDGSRHDLLRDGASAMPPDVVVIRGKTTTKRVFADQASQNEAANGLSRGLGGMRCGENVTTLPTSPA